jgi:hypothetical protein
MCSEEEKRNKKEYVAGPKQKKNHGKIKKNNIKKALCGNKIYNIKN